MHKIKGYKVSPLTNWGSILPPNILKLNTFNDNHIFHNINRTVNKTIIQNKTQTQNTPVNATVNPPRSPSLTCLLTYESKCRHDVNSFVELEY